MDDWELSKPSIGWTTPPPPPPLTPPRGGGQGGRVQNPSWASMAVALVLAILVGFVGVGVVLSRQDNSTSNSLAANPFTTSPPASFPATTTPSPNPSAPPAPVDPTAVAAKVVPAIVDVTTSLGYGAGSAAGTGMILSTTGDVLTNYHVIDGATSITVQINGSGPTYPATIVGTDRTDDVALLQITGASGLTTVQIGKSGDVMVGDQVVAVGNALGRGGPLAVASGTVAAVNQTATASDPASGSSETLTGLIQTTVPLQPGDSGGPLVNTTGQVIGMNTAALVSRRFGGGGSASSGVAFAIPIAHAISIATDIRAGKAGGNIQVGPPGYIGVQVRADGVVSTVVPGLPAEGAGVLAGDMIVSVDGTTIDSGTSLTAALGTHRAGDTVNVSWVDQSGQHHTAKMRLVAGTS